MGANTQGYTTTTTKENVATNAAVANRFHRPTNFPERGCAALSCRKNHRLRYLRECRDCDDAVACASWLAPQTDVRGTEKKSFESLDRGDADACGLEQRDDGPNESGVPIRVLVGGKFHVTLLIVFA